MAKILLVDDEPLVLKVTERIIRMAGYDVVPTLSAHAALRMLQSERVDAIVSDYNMPIITGLDFFNRVKKYYPEMAGRFIFNTSDPAKVEAHHPYVVDKIASQVLLPKMLESILGAGVR